MPGEGGRRGPPWVTIIGIALGLAALAAAWLLLPVQAWLQAFIAWVGGLGAWGPVFYAAIYALVVVVLAPAAPLSIGAGLVFGMWGLPVVLAGATAGAALAFLVSRYLLAARVRRMVERHPALAAVDRAVAEEGWRIVGLLRLSPLVPFVLQNHFFGVTRIGFLPYIVATAIGIAPGTALYVYLGVVGRSADGNAGPLKLTLIGCGLVATASVAVLVGRKARAVLAQKGVAPGWEDGRATSKVG